MRLLITCTSTEPLTSSVASPHANFVISPVWPTGNRSSATEPSALFCHTSAPSSSFVFTSPPPAPALVHFVPSSRQPWRVISTWPSVFGPVYSPVPDSVVQTIFNLPTVVSLTSPAFEMNPVLPALTPGCHSKPPPVANEVQTAVAYLPVPAGTFTQRPN